MSKEERRLSILTAAKEVFAERGYSGAGVADIIDRAGVARGTFYLYFESKRSVFAALIDHAIQAIQDLLAPISMDSPEGIVPGLLDNMERIKSYFLEDPDLARVIIVEAMLLDSDSSEQVLEVEQRLAAWLSGLVRRWQEEGILRPMSAEVVARVYLGSIKEILRQQLITGTLSQDIDEVTYTILDIFVFGLLAPEHNQLAADFFAGMDGPDDERNDP